MVEISDHPVLFDLCVWHHTHADLWLNTLHSVTLVTELYRSFISGFMLDSVCIKNPMSVLLLGNWAHTFSKNSALAGNVMKACSVCHSCDLD